ncbi:MAG: sigma-70 family RNA polymerase sigma factor [Planctomycetota bacterium]
MEERPITALLQRWRNGDAGAVDEVVPLLYDELLAIARQQLRGEQRGHTLQTTALVHEAWMRLTDADISATDRAHFLAIAARSMRRVLVDHARRKKSAKRGGGAARLDLDDSPVLAPEPGLDLVELNDALDALAEVDERKARIVELHFFGGLEQQDIATVTDVSLATVERDLRMARAWLRKRLG